VRKEKRQTDASLSLEEIMVFFRNWMIHHVLTEDRKLGMFLRRKTTT
jgi:hemerythrin